MGTKQDFLDRRQIMFGRKPDVEIILSRAKQKGLTAVVGRPKMGKTWLLQEAGRQLHEAGYLVGYHECLGESDQMLRVVCDLYSRWLVVAGNIEQAHSLWERHKHAWISKAGVAVGSVFSKIATVKGVPEDIGKLVEETFQGLSRADLDLKTGGISISPLAYEQAHELVSILHQVSQKPLVLIFDAWEQSASLDMEHKSLAAFLSHLDDWPPCHVLLGVRHPEKSDPANRGFDVVKDLKQSAPGTAIIYDLPLMHLDDAIERHNVAAHVRTKIPAAKKADDKVLLQMLKAFPGVLNDWLRDAQQQMKTVDDMAEVAHDAQVYRYREFDALFTQLKPAERTLAVRLVMFPRLDARLWPLFQNILLDGLNESSMDELNILHILEGGSFPTFGHETRLFAAHRWFLSKPEYRAIIAREVSGLLFRLSACVQKLQEDTKPFATAIILVGVLAREVQLENGALLLVASASTLFRMKPVDSKVFLNAVRPAVAKHKKIATLISVGLLNAINKAKEKNDLKRRDNLLNELRTLAQDCPTDAAVQKRLANALFNILCFAQEEKNPKLRDGLLNELRSLSKAHPSDDDIKEQLARGLSNSIVYANKENFLSLRDALLEELRLLVRAHPSNTPIQKYLASSLFHSVHFAYEKNNLHCCDVLVKELKVLAQAYPTVCELLAQSLVVSTSQEKDSKRRDGALNDLRSMVRELPADQSLQGFFANGLFNLHYHALTENNSALGENLLDELRLFAQIHPTEFSVLTFFARSLSNALYRVKGVQNSSRQVVLQNELLQVEAQLAKLQKGVAPFQTIKSAA